MDGDLFDAQADVDFIDAVIAAFKEAGAKRQRITHQEHTFSTEEHVHLENLELTAVGYKSRLKRLQILGR